MTHHDARTHNEIGRLRQHAAKARRREYRYALLAGICAVWATVATVAGWYLYQSGDHMPARTAHGELFHSLEALDQVVLSIARETDALADLAPNRLAALLDDVERAYAMPGSDLTPRDPHRQRRTAEVHIALSHAHLALDEPDKAAVTAARARDGLERLDPSMPRDRDRLAVAYIAEGDGLLALGDVEEAVAAFSEAATVRGALSAAAPDDEDALHRLSIAYERHGQALDELGEHSLAGSRFRQALAIRQQLAAAGADADPAGHEALAIAHSNLGDHAARAGNPETALAHYRNALSVAEELIERAPDDPARLEAHAAHLARIGRARIAVGETAAGLDQLDAAAEIYSELSAREPDNLRRQGQLADLLMQAGDVRLADRSFPAARSAFTRALDLRRHHAERGNADASAVQSYAEALFKLAQVDQAENIDESARLRMGEALELRRRLFEATPEDATAAAALAETLRTAAEMGVEPQAHLQEALAVLDRFGDDESAHHAHQSLAEDIRQRLASYTQ